MKTCIASGFCLLFLPVLIATCLLGATTVSAANRTVDSHADNEGPGTLRYEIGQSQDGDVITITTTSSLAVTRGDIVITTDLTIRAQTNAHAVIDGQDVTRIFYVSQASVTLCGLTLENARGPAAGGGALYLDASELRVENCTFANNVCFLADGGGIYARQSRIRLFNSDFNSNDTDYSGGAIFAKNTYVYATNCTFRHNGNPDDPNGGAIFGLLGAFEFYNSSFYGNEGHSHGGNVYLEEAPATVANCDFWDNDGYGEGLAMYFRIRTTQTLVTMDKCRVTSQNIEGDGSVFGFYTRNSGKVSVKMDACEIYLATNADSREAINMSTLGLDGSSLEIQHSTFANQSGRAICVDGDANITTIEHCEFYNNVAENNGGAIFIEDGQSDAEITIVNSSFIDNVVTGGLNSGGGAAVYITGDDIDFVMQGCRLENNWAKFEGGAVELSSFRHALFESCSFVGNTTGTLGGGALSIGRSGLQVTIASCTFASNRATASGGGAIYCDMDAPMLITTCTFTNNSAAVHGGALYVKRGAVNVESSDIHSSTAASQGGGIYVESGVLHCSDSDIRGGYAASGGAVYFQTAVKASFTDCEIVTNGCLDRGGAFAFSSDAAHTVTCSSVLFEDNACGAEGAGIYLLNGSLTVTSCSFVNNRAASGTSGGGIFQFNGTIDIHSTTFANNRSNFEGGAIKKNSGTMTVTECNFDGNTALGGNGGAILHQGGPTIINNTTFVNNTSAQSGGAIGAVASFLDVFNCTFSGNEADSLGGGLYSSTPGVDVASCTFTANIADANNSGRGDGGGIWAATDVFTSNIIAGNIDRGGECPDIGSILHSQGYNLIGTVGQFNFFNNTSGDRYGDPNGVVTPNPGALESSSIIDAQLEALADNGGFGQTHAIGMDSPAFNASTTAGLSLRDQRGQARFDVPDIGAFELFIPLSVTGPSTVCLGTKFKTRVGQPIPGASYAWAAFNGQIVSGGATCANVKVNSLAGGSVTLTETLSLGRVRTTSFTVSSVIFAAMDHVSLFADTSIEFDVLANDTGANLSLLSIDTPSTGSAIITSSGTIQYNTPNNFGGYVQFNYTATNNLDCQATGSVIVAVQAGFVNYANLGFIEREKNRKDGVRGLNHASDVVVSPEGKHAYAAGWLDNSIVMFNRDSASGELDYMGRMRHGRNGVTRMRYPAALVLSPDGEQLYVVANRDNSIVVFDRNTTTGKLSFLEYHRHNQNGVSGLKRPRAVAVSPLGDNVYVASYNGDAVAVFARDALTGRLQFQERHKNNIHGVRGINGAIDVSVSLDGRSVYVAGHADNAMALFERDLANGRLTFSEYYEDGIDGVDGLAGAASIAVSPDTKFVYVAGKFDNAIALFTRAASSGTLSFVGRIRDGEPGVKGLERVSDLALSKDGQFVFAVAETDNALTQFMRDTYTGELSKADKLIDGEGGIDGLKQAMSVALSDEGRYIYAAAKGDDAVAVFDWTRLPRGESKTITRKSASSGTTASFEFEYNADLPVTVQGYTNGTFGNVSILSNTTSGPYSRFVTFEYHVVSDDFPDTFTYTLENANGITTHTLTVVEELHKRATVLSGASSTSQAVVAKPQARNFPVNISPNPAQHFTDIAFVLDRSAAVRISIFDLSGLRVARIDLPHLPAGAQHVLWQVNSGNGEVLPQGSYIVHLDVQDGDGCLSSGSTMLQLVR